MLERELLVSLTKNGSSAYHENLNRQTKEVKFIYFIN